MIEDSKTDGLKRNVIEELNEIPLDDPNMFHDMSESFYTKKSYLTSYYRVYIGHPSIETPVSAASPFPSPPADTFLPVLTTPGPEGSTSINHQLDTSAQAAATTATTATTGLTRSSCHSLPPSLPLFKYVPAMRLIIYTCSIETTRITSISKPIITSSTSRTVSIVNHNATDLKNRESNLTQQAFDFT